MSEENRRGLKDFLKKSLRPGDLWDFNTLVLKSMNFGHRDFAWPVGHAKWGFRNHSRDSWNLSNPEVYGKIKPLAWF